MIVEVSVDIDGPRQLVFALMADARNETAWNSQVSKSELLTALPIGQGTQFGTVNRGQDYVGTITSFTEPEHVAFGVVGKALEIAATMGFEDSPSGGTTMSARFELRPKSFMKVVLPLIAPAVRRDFPKQLGSFKAFCESRA